jgi:predicted RNase H-like nuclease (RuvC/YqgF family)
MRIFNGEIANDSVIDMSNTVLKLSKLLSENFNHISEESCISILLENSFDVEVFESKDFSIHIVQDVSMILSSKDYVLKSLEELETIFKMASKRVKEKMLKKKLNLIEKKIYFYRVWSNSQINFHLKVQEIYENLKETK